ncbi:MAG: YwiC-like family protein [Cephaloticoccus sp.]|nr:YwiC-like family protein [Cephaloticoccus sp.]MCF7759814.1 YwiC-like family protein [Cephaloticoccus sp.]
MPSLGTDSRSIFLPKEHGSWSLAFEPVIFGLLVAPSPAGAALALSTAAAFFMRRPLKAYLVQRQTATGVALVVLAICAVMGFVEVLLLGSWQQLWPLAPALPLAGLFLYWDAQNEGRAAAAELAGCALFALLPATMATLSGYGPGFALSLAALMLIRSLPVVLAVRTWLRMRKGENPPISPAILVTLGALVAALALAGQPGAPWVVVALAAVACLRLLPLVTSWRPGWPARRIGMFEAVHGLVYIAALAFA